MGKQDTSDRWRNAGEAPLPGAPHFPDTAPAADEAHTPGKTYRPGGARAANARPAPQPDTPLSHPVHLKRRAGLDAVVFFAMLAGAGFLLPRSSIGIGVFLGLSAAGIVLFFLRRNADFTRLAAEKQALERATDGLGISLSAWHQGEPLAPWGERQRKTAPEAPAAAPAETTRAAECESL